MRGNDGRLGPSPVLDCAERGALTTGTQTTEHGIHDGTDVALAGKDRRFALLLGVPSVCARALCLAVLSTYLPLLARKFTSSDGGDRHARRGAKG